MFEARVFHTAKDEQYAAEYEDAYSFDAALGRAAIADGVSSAIFSRQWADILTRSAVEQTPDLYDGEAFQQWLAARRQSWLETIDVPRLPWNQRVKLRQVGGAYATLLWVELYPFDDQAEDEIDGAARRFRLRSFAVGDCSLFVVRGREVVASFPMESAADFDRDPVSICSVDLNRDHELEFQPYDADCREGDLLVLCSDAIGKWAFTRTEAGEPPDWEAYWDLPREAWLDEIRALRESRRMRYDDTTLLLLRVGAAVAGSEVPASADREEMTASPTEVAMTVPTGIEHLAGPDSPVASDAPLGEGDRGAAGNESAETPAAAMPDAIPSSRSVHVVDEFHSLHSWEPAMARENPAADGNIRIDGASRPEGPTSVLPSEPEARGASVHDEHDGPHDDPGATWIDPDKTHIQKR